VGLVFLPKTRRLQTTEWIREDSPTRTQLRVRGLPKRLQDGESLRAFGELDTLIDELHDGPSTEGLTSYPYVNASGTVYLPRDSKLARALRRRL
jgi:hypothetical protein